MNRNNQTQTQTQTVNHADERARQRRNRWEQVWNARTQQVLDNHEYNLWLRGNKKNK